MPLHIDTFHQPFFSAVCHFLKIIWPKITAVFRPISKTKFFRFSKLIPSPYTHISCSGNPVHLKIWYFFVLNTQYILDQYQMLTFCILPLHIDTFRVPKITVHFIFSKFFETIFSVHFRPISKVQFFWFSKYMRPHIHTFRVPYIRNILKLAKILCRIYGTFLIHIKN